MHIELKFIFELVIYFIEIVTEITELDDIVFK